jgi:hypothetical protein
MKSYQNEINYLKQKKDSLKNEMKLQQEGYTKQITCLLEDLSRLRSMDDSNNSKRENNKLNISTTSGQKKVEDSAIDEDSLSQNQINNMPVFTSTAQFVKTKTVTIPSHESAPIYVIETENLNESLRKLTSSQDHFEIQANNSSLSAQSQIENSKFEQLKEMLEKVKSERDGFEKQLQSLSEEMKSYHNDNSTLNSKYEQKLGYINEQVQMFQAENLKIMSENNELRLMQTKNNTELAQMM